MNHKNTWKKILFLWLIIWIISILALIFPQNVTDIETLITPIQNEVDKAWDSSINYELLSQQIQEWKTIYSYFFRYWLSVSSILVAIWYLLCNTQSFRKYKYYLFSILGLEIVIKLLWFLWLQYNKIYSYPQLFPKNIVESLFYSLLYIPYIIIALSVVFCITRWIHRYKKTTLWWSIFSKIYNILVIYDIIILPNILLVFSYSIEGLPIMVISHLLILWFLFQCRWMIYWDKIINTQK